MKYLALMLLVLSFLGVAACDSRGSSYQQGYDEGWSKGQEAGQRDGYQEGFNAARPPGWSPDKGFGAGVLGFTSFIGAMAALLGSALFVLYLIFTLDSVAATVGKALVAALSVLSAWVLTVIATTERVFFAILLQPVPNSAVALLIVILLFGGIAFLVSRLMIDRIKNVQGVRLEAFVIGLVCFLGGVVFQAFAEALSRAPHVMAYLICYVLIGFALGIGANIVRMLFAEHDRNVAAGKKG